MDRIYRYISLHYKRPEMRFHGIEALKKQMATDIAAGREYHGLSI